MTWRLLLLASALTVASTGWAATLEPESTWAVTRVGAKTAGAAPYCALARRFENNVIMTFARNTRAETSIAIDFQQPVFSTDQSVNVSFDSGGNEPREFLLKPASNKAVVARIGADRSFFSEMEAKRALDVSVMGQQYSFQMPDMAQANGQLENCINGLSSMPEPGGEGGRDVDNKIAALQDQIETLRGQRADMASGMGESEDLAAAAGGSNAELARQIAELQEQNLNLRSGVESQRSANDTLQTKSLENKSRVALLEETQDQLIRAQEDTKQFRDDLAATQARQHELLQKLEKYSSADAKRKELEQHLASLKDENGKLATSLEEEKSKTELVKAAQEAVLAESQQELAKTKTELAETATKLTATKTELNETAKQRDDYKSRLTEFSGIRDKLTELAASQKELGGTVQSLRGEREELTKNLDAERAKLKDIQTQLASGEKEKAEMQKLLEAEKAKQQDIAKLETNLSVLTEEQKKLAGQVGELEGEKKGLQIRISDLEKRVKVAEEEKREMAEALDEADQLVMHQSNTIDTLTLKQKDMLSQIASLETDKKDLLAQLDVHKTQLASLQSEAKKDRDFKFSSDRLNEQLADTSKERDALQKQVADLKEKNTQTVITQGGIPENDTRELFTQVEELEYQRVDLNSALEFERAKNLNEATPAAGTDMSLAELKASLAAAQAQRDEYKRLLDEERARSKELEAIAGPADAQQTVAELNTRIKKLEVDNVNLLRELEYEKSRALADNTSGPIAAPGSADAVTISRLRDEIKRVQKNAHDTEKKQEGLLAQIRTLEAEKQKMAAGAPADNAAEKTDLQMKIVALEAEKDSLAKSLAQRPSVAKITPAVAGSPAAAAKAPSAPATDEAAKEIVALRTQLAQAQTLLAAREAQAANPPTLPAVAQAPIQSAPLPDIAPAAPPQPKQAQKAAAVPPAPVATASPIVDRSEPMAAQAPMPNREGALRQILAGAGMGNPNSFGPVTLPVASNVQAWRWKTGQLAGNAEAHPAPDQATQNAVIENFLAKAKSRCPGDFAVIENSRTQSQRGLVVSTDIACVAGANGVAAAIAFVQMDGQLVIISHEAGTATMPEAMTARDKIVQSSLK